jgi:glutamine synthetase
MNPRTAFLKEEQNKRKGGSTASNLNHFINNGSKQMASEKFGMHVFNRSVMQKMLPREIYLNLVAASEGVEKLRPEYADTIAVAMKEWAVDFGATHFTHWFFPLTGASAEKHDSFIEWNPTEDNVVEKFTGKQLLQGEPDASSFPSGGLRSTYEARGYTGWDPSSPVFIWKGGDGVTLCIPSVFISWTGDVLDSKIPLHRSEKKLNSAVSRLLKLTGIEIDYTYTTLGLEQEYFVVDRRLRNLRPDLVLTGRTVLGAPSPKGQELQDHYFASVNDRILSFMHDFESRALEVSVPVQTRHNEVAPSQYEVAHVFEKSTSAIDHNILMMELMRQTAEKHGLACLLHEKPFQGLNGSGKHANWSIMTNTGINLLDPTDLPENNLHFLVLMTSILNAIYEHSALLRASIGSASNDCRLGGHEAPPAIISVYLGEELEELLSNIEKSGSHKTKQRLNKYNLGLSSLPDLSKDNTDRNRTSPFAFTGNKFEFRAVGSSSNPSFSITVLNAVVAESLNKIIDEIEKNLGKKQKPDKKELAAAATSVLQKYLKKSKNIRFSGDNYSREWTQEAKKRKLPNIQKSPESFKALLENKTIDAFKDILLKHELESRFELMMDHYIQTIEIELKVMLEMFRTQIFPAAIKTQNDFAGSLAFLKDASISLKKLSSQKAALEKLAKAIEDAQSLAEELDKVRSEAARTTNINRKGEVFVKKVLPLSDKFRLAADRLETLVDDQYWPIPKYREILFPK